jgi:uncharacterized protein (DUF305 family)
MREEKRFAAQLILLAGIIVALLISAGSIPAKGPGRTQNNRPADNRNDGSQDSGDHGGDAATQDWADLMTGMHKMHAAMGSVKDSGDSEVNFVSLMLPHHQAAIDMAKAQLLHGKDPQMRRLAQEIITDQQSEIELMQLWLKQHGAVSSRR